MKHAGFVGFHNGMGGCEEFTVIYEGGRPVFKGHESGKFLYINNDGSASGAFTHTDIKNQFEVQVVSAIVPGSPMDMQLQRAIQMKIRYEQLEGEEGAAWAAHGMVGGVGGPMQAVLQAGAVGTALNIGADQGAIYDQNFVDIARTPLDNVPSVPAAAVVASAPYPGAIAPYPGAIAPYPGAIAPLPPGWRELKTPDGQVYFANDMNGTTSWTRPS